jgi:hypothetical protein
MGLPVAEIQQVLTQMGLEQPEVRIVRMTGVRVRLVITAFLDPERFVPIRDPSVDMVDTLPRPPVDVDQIAVGAEVQYSEPPPAPSTSPPAGRIDGADDLTIVTGIGKTTATKLYEAGYHTIAALRTLSEEELANLLSPSSIKQVKAWLSSNP